MEKRRCSMMTELLNPKEAAVAMKCSIHTVRAWTFQRKLPVVRLGRKVLFRREDIEAFINKNVIEAKAE
jgi:excisionase family DNA binding protein